MKCIAINFKPYLIIACIIILLLSGCSVEKKEVIYESPLSIEGIDNENTRVLANYGHGPVFPVESNTYYYTGEEIRIPYSIATDTGVKLGCGIMLGDTPQLFNIEIDGERVVSDEVFYAFDVDANQEIQFNYVFTPIAGEKGSKTELRFWAIENPYYLPTEENPYYMQEQYFSVAPYTLEYKEESINVASHSSFQESTFFLINKKFLTDFQRLGVNQQVSDVIKNTQLDTEIIQDHYEEKTIIGKNKINIKFLAFGYEEGSYCTHIYINHKPIKIMQKDCLQFKMIKGKATQISFEVDIENLPRQNVIYAITTPVNKEGENLSTIINKTQSKLLINEGVSDE